MKNILKTAAAVIVFFASATAFAQDLEDTRDQLKFGIRAGINYSNVYDEEGEDFVADSKVGFVGGGFVSIPFGKIIGIQPEILYSQKGFKATGSVLGFDYDYKQTNTYLDIPLQLQIKPIPQLTILAGPQYSYLLDTKYDFNGETTTEEEDAISEDNYKENIFGFVVGADLNLNNFIIGVRGGWDITETDRDGDSESPRFKNQVLQVTLGYSF